MAYITIGAIIIVVLLVLFVIIYRRVKTNTALVIWGKGTGSSGRKIILGGGSIVLPVLQASKVLSLEPFVAEINLTGALSKNNIRVNTPSTFTLAISKDEQLIENAATRLLDLSLEQLVEQASDVIFGQLRAVIAGLTIEEINADREKFEREVTLNVAAELAKLGLELINVNIKDITDDSDYIIAIGKKAAAEAIQQAQIDVANETKKGEIGKSEAMRDQEVRVAALNAEQEIGRKEAEKNEVIKVAQFEAEKVKGENVSIAEQAESQKILQIKQAEYFKESEVAKAEAEIAVQKKKAEQEIEKLRAEEVVKIQAQKEKIILEAEAEKERQIRDAEGDAQEILLKAKAEAEGIALVYNARAEGYKKLVSSIGNPKELANILLVEQLPQVTEIKSEALKNIKIDKITVWDNPSSGSERSGLNGFVDNFMESIPAMHEIAKDAGIELPQYLGTADDSSVNSDEIANKE